MTRALLFSLCLLAACGEKGSPEGDSGVEADADGDGYSATADCDDTDAAVHPGAAEACDGVDNNCDGAVDEGLLQAVYADADGDGYGLTSEVSEACAPAAGQSLVGGDCNDAEALVHPGAQEVCDGLDNDCDGLIDDESAADLVWLYPDLDGDGYGDPEAGQEACPGSLSGFVSDDTDCDDSAAAVHPGAEELCDGVDTDCDGAVAEAMVPSDYSSAQAAFNAGETDICLEAGTHREQLVLHTVWDLRLRGVDRDLVILSGSGRVIDVTGSSGSLTLSGLTVRDGYSETDYASGLYYDGDGTGAVLIEDVLFFGNACEGYRCYGAAAYVGDYDSAELVDVEISDSWLGGDANGDLSLRYGLSTVLDGVTIYNGGVSSTGAAGGYASALLVQGSSQSRDPAALQINDLLVENNRVGIGGSLYAPVTLNLIDVVDVTNSSIVANQVQVSGDCISPSLFAYYVAELNLNNVVLSGNSCTAGGLGYSAGPWHYGWRDGSTAVMENVIVAGNWLTSGSEVYGAWGVVYESDVTWKNSSVRGNRGHAPEVQAGWRLLGDASLTLYNTDVSGNEVGDDRSPSVASGFGGDSTSSLSASWSNLTDLGDTPFSSHFGDPLGQAGMLSAAPRYVDVQSEAPQHWDLNLTSSSPLLDAGDPSLQDPDGSRSDIGAFGGPGAGSW